MATESRVSKYCILIAGLLCLSFYTALCDECKTEGNACQMSHECCSVCYKGMCASLILPAAGMPFQQDTVPEENFLSLSSASSNARKSKSKARARARNKVKKARAFSRSMFYGDYDDDNCLGYGENCNHHHQCCDGYCHFGHSFDCCA